MSDKTTLNSYDLYEKTDEFISIDSVIYNQLKEVQSNGVSVNQYNNSEHPIYVSLVKLGLLKREDVNNVTFGLSGLETHFILTRVGLNSIVNYEKELKLQKEEKDKQFELQKKDLLDLELSPEIKLSLKILLQTIENADELKNKQKTIMKTVKSFKKGTSAVVYGVISNAIYGLLMAKIGNN